MSGPVSGATKPAVTPASAVWLVAQRELNTRLRTRGFVIGTAVILVAMAGFLLLQTAFASGMDRTKVGLSGQATAIAEPLTTSAEQLGMTVETQTVPSGGRALLESGDVDVVVSGSPADLRVAVKSELDDRLRAVLNGISQEEVLGARLMEAGQNPGEVMRDVGAAQVRVTALEEPDPERGQRIVIAIIMMILLYMSIIMWGTTVAQGIVEEKSSRVVEILLSTVRPWHLLLGKVLGLGLVGLAQLTILGVVGLVMARVTGVLTITGVATGTLLWGLVWYVLGYFLYATVFAGAGSLVSRQEDMQTVLTPITLVLVAGFVAGITAIQQPDGTTAQVLALLPPLSPILMPSLIATGAAGPLDIALALALTLAAIAALTWLGGRVYQTAILHTGSRLSLKAALKRW